LWNVLTAAWLYQENEALKKPGAHPFLGCKQI
jgi:hypothetical protein